MVITISNRYGSGAAAIARLIAGHLGYEYVDEQLPVVVATRLQTSPQVVESEQDSPKTVSERMLRAFQLATPELGAGQEGRSFEEQCLREVQDAVREYAAHGNVVIFGRGANAILGRRPDVLRVFLYAPRDRRIHNVMQARNIDSGAAAAEIARIDRAREVYMRQHYNLDWSDPTNYDLVIDTSTFGPQGSAALVVRAVEAR